MKEIFERVLDEITEEFNAKWWNVIDEDLREEFLNRIANELNITIEQLEELPDFVEWENEYYEEL